MSKTIIISSITFLIGTILGSGAIWQYLQYKNEQQRQLIELYVKTTELRNKQSTLLGEMIELTNSYLEAIKLSKETHDSLINNRIVQLSDLLKLKQNNIEDLEKKLAELEKRTPRKINLKYIPPETPFNLKVR